MRKLLLVLLLSLPVLALPTPEEVVIKLYRTHIKTQDASKTVAQLPRTFTAEFRALIDKGLAKQGLDSDLFTHQKANMTDFELTTTSVQTTQAQVHLQIWTGGRLGQQKGEPQEATIYLLDLEGGVGYQIDDIQFQAKPRFRLREFLKALVGN
jgi:hypothetical protein